MTERVFRDLPWVQRRYSIARATVKRWIKNLGFPKPFFKFGRLRWVEQDILDWEERNGPRK